jgi:hypothetical protein
MAEQVLEPLLAELRSVIERADPVPDAVIAGAKACFTWRTIDAELAELVADSGLIASATRSSAAARLLTFEGAGLTVEVEVGETGATRHLVGQLIPVGRARITLRWAAGSRDVEADELGRFTADDIPAGAVSMSVQRGNAAGTVVTSWVSI